MLNRIIWHHSAGRYTPSALDRRHYHRIIDGDGQVHDGDFRPEANAAGRPMREGAYAAHTRNLNTGSIGLAIAAMAGASWANPRACAFFPTPAQVSALIAETARLCTRYGIVPTARTVLSHAEVEITLGVKQAGKWDLDYDLRGADGRRDPVAVGDALRREVKALMADDLPAPPLPRHPVLRQGDAGDAVAALQRALALPDDGRFGPVTAEALRAFQRRCQMLPDAVAGPLVWAALFPKETNP